MDAKRVWHIRGAVEQRSTFHLLTAPIRIDNRGVGLNLCPRARNRDGPESAEVYRPDHRCLASRSGSVLSHHRHRFRRSKSPRWSHHAGDAVALARGHILMCPVLFFGLALSKFSKEEGLKQSSWYGLILKPVISVSGLLREKGRAEVRKETSETEGCSEGT